MTDKSATRAVRQRRDRLPRNRQRERVLSMVREHNGAVDAVELASAIGLHVTTVRFHLDALCEQGVIARTTLKRPSAGRPRTGYVPVQEHMDYRILAEVLGMELGQTAHTRARRAARTGRKWAARMVATQSADAEGNVSSATDAQDPLDREAQRATEVFTRMGFEAELAAATDSSERVIRLHACPVRDLARAHPDVGCALHLGLLQGLIDNPPDDRSRSKGQHPALSADLEPLVEPELCLARVIRGD